MNARKTMSLSMATLAMFASTAFAESITVVAWGGSYTKSQVEAYYKPWYEKTGNTVISEDYSGGLAEVKSQVETNNVTWDIIDLELSNAIRGCDEGLFETIDPSILPAAPDGTAASDDFIPGALHECAVGNVIWSTIFAYDGSKFSDGPKTIADFFDIAKFPGKRGMRKNPSANLEMALAADGVPNNEIYDVLSTPEGVDRAFSKLDTIKDSVVWWEAGAQPPQLLADGEVAMTTAYNGRIFSAIADENKPFVIVWDGQVFDMDLFAIPKGTPNKELAMDFLAFSTATVQLASQASYIPYGPARKSSVPLVGAWHNDPDLPMDVQMPTYADNFQTALQNDFEFWADNQDELNERFNTWLNK